MATLVSPGILVQEKDLTGIVTGDSSTIGAIAIASERGPVDEVIMMKLLYTQTLVKLTWYLYLASQIVALSSGSLQQLHF